MTIKVGDSLPDIAVFLGAEGGPQPVQTQDLFAGKKVVLFGVPGAFTPTCSAQHLPGFITHADAIKGKGVDRILCMSVNDGFVMAAWGKSAGAEGSVEMLADGDAAFTKALGLELDLNGKGLGLRNQRFALVADNGVVSHLMVEEGGAFDVSSAESVLAAL